MDEKGDEERKNESMMMVKWKKKYNASHIFYLFSFFFI